MRKTSNKGASNNIDLILNTWAFIIIKKTNFGKEEIRISDTLDSVNLSMKNSIDYIKAKKRYRFF